MKKEKAHNFSGRKNYNYKSAIFAFSLIMLTVFGFELISATLINNKNLSGDFSLVPTVKAGSVYYNFTGGNLTLNIDPNVPASLLTLNTKDDWSGHASIEGFCGDGLTTTFGVNPQTVLAPEFGRQGAPPPKCINPNNGNPSAFNTGGVAEFDRSGHYAIGFQGNVQSNPYLLFYLNTTGQPKVFMSYEVTDIDEGSNNSVSPVALQYRVGETGNFINIPEGSVADATDGPNFVGRKTTRGVFLPAAALNQPKVQVRLITTDAAAPDGTSTPDEWIGINNIVVTNQAPTAASVSVGGRAMTAYGKPVSRALVTMMDSMGNTRTAITNSFGFFRFNDVAAGDGYVFSIFSKRYVFTQPTQFLQLNGEDDSINFIAEL